MKILVTGAGGFIGSHLVEYLVKKGYNVRAFVHYNSFSTLGWLEEHNLKDEVELISGDIRDMDSVAKAVQGVEVVFHLASLIGIPYSYVSPLAYIKTNVEGSYNVLESVRRFDVAKMIHTSTSEVYGTAQYVPINEKHPINPQSPYAASKSAADHFAMTYYKSFGTPVTVIRPFNTYGPRQSARAIIPTIVAQILNGQKTLKLGNVTPTRDLNFVTDTVKGFVKVGLDETTTGKILNLGTGKEITIEALVKKIAAIMNIDVQITTDEKRLRPSKSEVERLCCDASAANSIGWSPDTSLDDGLRITIKWLESNLRICNTDRYLI